jgi:hypothetical protein
MSILSFVLLLLVIGVVVYAIKLAIAGNWKELLWLVVGLIVVIIVLGVLGIQLPNIPRLG